MVEAEQLADSIVILKDGHIIDQDTPTGIRQKIPSRHYLQMRFRRPLPDIERLKKRFIVSRDRMTAMLPLKRGVDINEYLQNVLRYQLPMSDIKIVEPSLEEAFNYLTRNNAAKPGPN